VTIVKDRDTGRPRGFAFVEMSNGQEAANAIKELNLREIQGRSITVNEARPKTDRPRRGGGRQRTW
jgi:cold-inducible RNA-binding protein